MAQTRVHPLRVASLVGVVIQIAVTHPNLAAGARWSTHGWLLPAGRFLQLAHVVDETSVCGSALQCPQRDMQRVLCKPDIH